MTKRWLHCDAPVLHVLFPQLRGLRLPISGGLTLKIFGYICDVTAANSVNKQRGVGKVE